MRKPLSRGKPLSTGKMPVVPGGGLLAELGEGVLEGGVVGRALGVLHVRHLNGGLVDHARGRVK